MTDSLYDYLEAGANCKKLTGRLTSRIKRHPDYPPVFIPTLKKANTHSNHDHVKPGGNSCNLLSHFHLSNKSIIPLGHVVRTKNASLEFRLRELESQ